MNRRNNFTRLLLLLLAVGMVIGLVVSVLPKKPADDPGRAGGYSYYTPQSYSAKEWNLAKNTMKLDTGVMEGARAKRTHIRGNGQDIVTIMVYMCGADLESRAAMGSYDLQEMANAKLSDNVNLLVYTGGTTKWHIQGISNKTNQIYRVLGDGQIECIVQNAGNAAMVNPETLLSFLDYSSKNYPANRYELILWDHGSGSIGGYGIDERFSNQPSMSYAEIDKALTNSGLEFDFIGFDACLMATLENGLMLAEHADYLIASEEAEPGIGWYYTNWLTNLAQNTSMPTIEIGKNIADDFVAMSAQKVPNQSATLSVIDLAELSYTIPKKLTAFAQSANELLQNQEYQRIAKARSGSREFATQQGVDLIDMVDMASKINTDAAQDLAISLLSAVKYNNVSSDMTNSYGISIYFPYRSTKYVNTVLKNYQGIDMDKDYQQVIRNFASYQTSGQVSSGGNNNPYASLLGNYPTGGYSSQTSSDSIMSLLNMFLGGDSSYTDNSSYSSFFTNGLEYLFGRSIDLDKIAGYVADNHFSTDLTWKNGKIKLSEEQWALVDDLQLNVFVKDKDGYIDLGTDNVFEIDDNGNLLEKGGDTWLALSCDKENWTVVPYYYLSTTLGENDSYIINGRIPVMLNGDSADLLVTFTSEKPEGTIAGAVYTYDDIDVVAKNLVEINDGDELKFICAMYDFNGNFVSNYVLNDPLFVNGEIHIGDIDISDYEVLATYQFTDLYQQNYWTTPIKN